MLLQAKRYTQSPLETEKVVHADGDLHAFVTKNILPLVGELTNDNQPIYHSADVPLVKIYSDLDWKGNSKGANYLLNKIRKVYYWKGKRRYIYLSKLQVAKEYKDKFVFAVTSKSKNQKETEDFGLPKVINSSTGSDQ